MPGATPPERAAGPCHASGDPGVWQHGVDPLVPRVEQMVDVDPRSRRPEPEPLVRLVPDQPITNPRVATRDGGREAAEVSWPRRGEVRRASSIRPCRRPDQRDNRRQSVAAKSTQNLVRPAPVVGAVTRRGRPLGPSRGGLVPADREADERHAESLERRQPLVEGSRAELQPGVVLDPKADARRGRSGARRDAGRERQKQDDQRQPARSRPHRRPSRPRT